MFHTAAWRFSTTCLSEQTPSVAIQLRSQSVSYPQIAVRPPRDALCHHTRRGTTLAPHETEAMRRAFSPLLARTAAAPTTDGVSQQMNEKSQLKDGPQVAPVEATGLACRMERYLTLLACSSDSNLRILKRLLRLGLAFVFCAELASWLETTLFEPALVVPLRPFLIFDLALAAAFVGFTYLPCFEGKWRAVAMTFCLSLVASS